MKKLWVICWAMMSTIAIADIQTYGFDDGTLQGWSFTDLDFEDLSGGSEFSVVVWEISEAEIELGENDWNLLQGSTVNGIGTDANPQREPNYRVIPTPWSDRDCIGVECLTMLFRSPVFKLDDSGPISVDIVGGQGKGGSNVDVEVDVLPVTLDDFDLNKSGQGYQGFALYDVEASEYVEYGFPTINNDGKEKDGRGVWETVEISADDLATYANNGKDYRVDIFDSLSGGWGWMGFDTVRIPNADFANSVAGDCDDSGSLDAGDLGCVATVENRDAILAALNTVPGDLDGNGFVEFADFLVLSSNFGKSEGTYSDGNIDLVGGVEFADFLTLSGNFGAEPAGAQAVPEPSGAGLAISAAIGLCLLRRRTVQRS